MSDMQEEIKEILDDIKRHLDYVEATKQSSIRDNEMKAMYDYIINLQEENIRLKELCDKYEEEHSTTFIEWQKDINIIDGLEKWLKEQVFNKAGSSVDLAIENHSYCKVLDKLNELRGDNK